MKQADYENERLKICGNPKHIYGYGVREDVPNDGIQVEYDEGWGMVSGPDFGCVNHEQEKTATHF